MSNSLTLKEKVTRHFKIKRSAINLFGYQTGTVDLVQQL
ncbi:MAG: hypothetical protein ACI9LG_001485 [Moritella dasanensis]|jgi:hypothetical protein